MIRALPDAEGVLQLELLSSLAHVRHGFPTRRGRLHEVLPGPVARLRQVHGADVLVLPEDPEARAPFLRAPVEERPTGDALVTDQPGVAVAVAVADCLPVLIADRRDGPIAAVHAGWRGLAGGIIENAVRLLESRFGSDPSDLLVGMGPAIGPCCFEVGEEVIEAFAARGYGNEARVDDDDGPRPHAHLSRVARAILRRLGVPPDQIADAALCTRCNSEWLWSYRVDGDMAGRMVCGILRDGQGG